MQASIPHPAPALSLEEKVGQLFLVGVRGKTLSAETQARLEQVPFGNFLLFRENIGDDDEVRQLTASLSAIRRIPPWIAIDQEGGTVVRIDTDPTAAISQASLIDDRQAFEVARARGNFLRSLGINMPLSPVVDHATSARAGLAQRTFLNNWGQFGDAMVRGYRAAQTIPVVKHFPSYGDLQGDVEADIPHKTISAEEIAIFREALKHAPVLMISPIIVDNLDPHLPAPLSPTVIRFIRHELQFNGVILTDDAQMRAVQKRYAPEEFASAALEAGVDMLMFSEAGETAEKTFRLIMDRTKNDEVREKNVEKSVQRIMRIK